MRSYIIVLDCYQKRSNFSLYVFSALPNSSYPTCNFLGFSSGVSYSCFHSYLCFQDSIVFLFLCYFCCSSFYLPAVSTEFVCLKVWHYVAIRCVCAPIREFLCLLWLETYTKDWGWRLPRDRKWRRKGRSERRLREAVDKGRRRDAIENGEQKKPVGVR